MELKNINDKPNLVLLEGDEKFFAYMEKNGKRVYIGQPKYDDFQEETLYPIYLDEDKIAGTGTNSLGHAISWCETYLNIKSDPGILEMLLEDIDDLDRKTSTMRQVLLDLQRMANEKKEDK